MALRSALQYLCMAVCLLLVGYLLCQSTSRTTSTARLNNATAWHNSSTARPSSATARPNSAGCPSPHLCTLLVLVFSRPNSFDSRRASRRTWVGAAMNNTRADISILFVVGTQGLSAEAEENVLSESKTLGDLLILPEHQDTYSNLTGKLQLSLRWAVENRNYCSYVMKADDDCYIVTDRLLPMLRTRSPTEPIVWGDIQWHARPQDKGKYAEHNWIYGTEYLPYPMGTGYVLSFPLVNTVMSAKMPLRILFNDDVSIGLWVAPYNVEYKHFKMVRHVIDPSVVCKNTVVVLHSAQTPKLFYMLHKLLLSSCS